MENAELAINSHCESGLFCRRGPELEMPDPTPPLGSLADTAAVAPRMMPGQFRDDILDPAIRELKELDRTIDACGKRADSLSRNLSAEAPRRSGWYEPRLRVIVLFDYQRALAGHCACSGVHWRIRV